MSQEINNRDNMTEGVSSTSAIIEVPETKTTTISTSKTENPLINNDDNNNVKDEKSKVIHLQMRIGSGLMSTFSETSKKGELIGYLWIAGIGIGYYITILASQHVVAREDLARVTSLITFFRTIGAVFGVAILGTIFNNELKNHLSGGASSFSQSGFGGGERGGLGNVPDSIKPLILNAFISSFSDFSHSFKVVTVMGALTLISALFMENTKPARKRTEKIVEKESK